MPERPLHLVSAAELQALLRQLQSDTVRPAEGIFGLRSVSWRVNREAALFLAAGRAALLQLAHPWVAAAIAEHSRTLKDPSGRFHQTFRTMFTLIFAPLENAIETSQRLYRRHSTIRGTLPEANGRFAEATPYEANELSALRWVYATLVDSALVAYELVLPKLSAADTEQYFQESKRTAAMFGISRDSLPQNWQEFRLYFDSILLSDELGVSTTARYLAQQLQEGAGLRVRTPLWYHALTISLLPTRLQQEFHFSFGGRERRAVSRSLRLLRSVYPHLPATFRFVGPYNEALSRLNGKPRPHLFVRLSNRIWIGQPSLIS